MKHKTRIRLWKVGGHLLGLSPVVYIIWLNMTGRLGFDPVKELIHTLGFAATFLLMMTLLVTPLRRQFPTIFAPLLVLRRLLGLWAFFWASAHVVSFLWLELGWQIRLLTSEVIKRPYLWLGMAAWLLLLVLTLTSTHKMQERLHRHWRTLHRSIYLIALLVGVHYWWSLKVTNVSDALWIVTLWIVVGLRWLPVWWRIGEK